MVVNGRAFAKYRVRIFQTKTLRDRSPHKAITSLGLQHYQHLYTPINPSAIEPIPTPRGSEYPEYSKSHSQR